MRKYSVAISLAFAYLLFTTFLLCLPGSEFPKLNWLNKIWFDKWVHIGLFFVLVFLWCRAIYIKKGSSNSLKKMFLGLASVMLVYGLLMELVQHYFIPFRSFDVGDIIADAVGCFGGVYLANRRYIKK